MDWVLACEAKGHWFKSQLGPMPGLRAGSPVAGACERQPHTDVSVPPSPLKRNKILKKKKEFEYLKHSVNYNVVIYP